jgi:hypothetical protein
MTLLADLLELPETVHQGDFVLRLSEGVADPTGTLRHYVVTPDLAENFDQALTLVRAAVEGSTSKGAYLHGSFGSGKSHFMAVLNLLLGQDAGARAIPELSSVVATHDAWLAGRGFLLVPYHLIGAESLDAAVLGGYVEHVRRVHPEAGYPAVFVDAPILDNARTLRAQMGDDRFFAALGDDAPNDDAWGDLGGGWDPVSFDEALAADRGHPARERLVASLVTTVLSGYADVARGGSSGYVSLDEGLAAISAHAKGLGYDAVVLFLDELILWLASRISDTAFVSAEAAKVSKLVEAGNAARPAPIVSFIARQRDLRDLVGGHVSGALTTALTDVLAYWEGRFATITLADRNLAAIAAKRLLRPKSDAARAAIDAEFERTTQVRREVWDALLTSQADRDLFRASYPFSPAFMKALIDVSGALQRERTALKVMALLLNRRRHTLELGQLVPVGDLWDVIAEGDEPFTEEMRGTFDAAKRLYRTKLRPLLLHSHGLDKDAADAVADAHPFRTDDRLVKTLLLSALVPQTEPLRDLTAARLAALNHGTITSPIPGQEVPLVLSKVKTWASQVGEVRVGEEPTNPILGLELLDVDTDSITGKARHVDTTGSRRTKVRTLMLKAIGLKDPGALILEHRHLWKGALRPVEVVFGNVRDRTDLRDQVFTASGPGWRVVIDFPFDDEGFGPLDDLSRVERMRAEGATARSACWLPAHLTKASMAELGDLVVLDHVLAGDRFDQLAAYLPPAERGSARQQLEGKARMLTQRIERTLLAAYGVAAAEPGTLEGFELADRFPVLDPSFTLRPPTAATLAEAFAQLLDQCLAQQYPGAPELAREVKAGDLRTVLERVREANGVEDGRIVIADHPTRRVLREVANPLKVGTMHEAPFVLEPHWIDHFDRRMAASGVSVPTVAQLRGWIDDPRPMGLPARTANLIIAAFAIRTGREATLHGTSVPIDLDLADEVELAVARIVSEEVWAEARLRAAAVLGVSASPLRSAASVGELAQKVRTELTEVASDARRLVQELEARAPEVGLDVDLGTGRLATARRALTLADAVTAAAGDNDTLEVLAASDLAPSLDAVGRSLRTAGSVAAALHALPWDLVSAALALGDHRASRAQALAARLEQGLVSDQLALALEPRLVEVRQGATELLAEVSPAPWPPSSSAPRSPPSSASPPAPGVERGEWKASTRAEAERRLEELRARLAAQEEWAEVSVSWELRPGATPPR